LLAALCIAGGRLAYVASKAESGWSTLATQWQDTLLEKFGFGYISVDSMEPPEQADFWMSEIDRLEKPISESASMQMGAAWVLDSASIGFLRNHWKDSGFGSTIPAIALQIDKETVDAAKEKFRLLCLDRCLLLARKATDTEPNDVRWWRMRALLLFESDPLWSGNGFDPRCDDWLKILDSCSRRDPENALYDYLAALQLWKQAATYDWPGSSELPTDFDGSFEDFEEFSELEDPYEGGYGDEGGYGGNDNAGKFEESDDLSDDLWILTINDEKKYAAGTEHFLVAQTKDFLAVGEAGFPAVANFVEQARLRKADQADVTVSRMVTARQTSLISRLWRWQGVRGDHAQQRGDAASTKEMLLQNSKLYDQAIVPIETSAMSMLTDFAILRKINFDELEKFFETHPELATEGEIDAIRQREKMLRIETETLQLALQKLNSTREQVTTTHIFIGVFAEVAIQSTVCLLVLAICCLITVRVWASTSHDVAPFGYLRHALAWLLGYGVTFLIFGAFPAEMIDRENQALIANAALYGLAFFAVFACGRSLYRRKLRFRLSSLFVVTTAVALLAFLWPLIDFVLWSFISNPAELLPQAKGYYGLSAELFCSALNTKSDSLFGAIMQWHFYHGSSISFVLSLSIALIWYMRLCCKKLSEGFFHYWTHQFQSRWPSLLHFVGRIAAVVAACWFFAYFCVAPTVVRVAEADFHYKMDYCRNPESHYAKIRKAQEKIKSSTEEMTLIIEQIEFELSDEEVFERDFAE